MSSCRLQCAPLNDYQNRDHTHEGIISTSIEIDSKDASDVTRILFDELSSNGGTNKLDIIANVTVVTTKTSKRRMLFIAFGDGYKNINPGANIL